MMKLSKNAQLEEASAWIECAEQGAELPEVSKKLLDLEKLRETKYFEVMKKLVKWDNVRVKSISLIQFNT